MQEVMNFAQQANSDRELRELMRDRERFLIDQHLDRVDSYEEGVEEGREEGRKEGIKNIINIMLSNGTTKETIMKQMNISNEEYEMLVD